MFRFTIEVSESLSINHLRVALLNYIQSHQESDTFFLRINDLHSSIEGEEQTTIDILKKFAIDTENRHNQSKNLSIYQQMAKRLVNDKKAYLCFCNEPKNCQCKDISQETLQKRIQSGEKFILAMQKPLEAITFTDIIYGEISHKPHEIGTITLLHSDGKPSTQFATAVDDMSNDIHSIIDELQNSLFTAQTLYIQQQLSFTSTTKYFHIPSLKMAKTQDSSLKYLLQEGFLPDAIIHYLLKLTAPIESEVYYLPDAIKSFDFTTIPPINERVFSLEELREINRIHLKHMEAKKLSSIFGFADSDIGNLLKLFLNKAATINELEEFFTPLFQKKECNEQEKELSKIILNAPYFKEYTSFKNYLLSQSSFNEEELEKSLRKLFLGVENDLDLGIIYNYLKSYLLEVVQCR